jgi:hypothetical protein
MGFRDEHTLEKVLAMKDEKEFLNQIRKQYVRSSYAMVSAFKECDNIFERSLKARNCVASAVEVKSISPEIKKQCQTILEELRNNHYWEQLERSMIAIKGDEGFLKQLNAKSLKDAADAAERNATANTVNAFANLTRRH